VDSGLMPYNAAWTIDGGTQQYDPDRFNSDN
jgi:hypothetical protein